LFTLDLIEGGAEAQAIGTLSKQIKYPTADLCGQAHRRDFAKLMPTHINHSETAKMKQKSAGATGNWPHIKDWLSYSSAQV
jgi:hypothetical protein